MISDFRDLVAWQLCHTLKCEIFEFTAVGPASRDFKYRDQIRESSASAARNIAEGFKRYRPAEFARFLEFALGSLGETKDALIDGFDRKYLDEKLFTRLLNLTDAAAHVTRNLLLSKQRQIKRRGEK